MMTSRLTSEQIALVSELVTRYITHQRQTYASRATLLSREHRNRLEGFFTAQLLDDVRILVLRGEHVANPDFYPMLRRMGFANLPDQSTMAAITFSDVVVSHQPFSPGLLFHELVHVEQYRQLGIGRFSDLYVRGFLSGGGYDGIPLERCAYELGGRYEAEPGNAFSVQNEVRAWISGNRF